MNKVCFLNTVPIRRFAMSFSMETGTDAVISPLPAKEQPFAEGGTEDQRALSCAATLFGKLYPDYRNHQHSEINIRIQAMRGNRKVVEIHCFH